MTAGSWSTGTWYYNVNTPDASIFTSEKEWNGTDGIHWSDDGIHHGKPWHTYAMFSRKYQMLAGKGKLKWHSIFVPEGDSAGYIWPIAPAPNLNLWDNFMELQLLEKLTKKVKGHDFHIGVSLAEVDKTASMVTNSLGKITRGVWELSRGNVPGALRAWGSTASKKTVSLPKAVRVGEVSRTRGLRVRGPSESPLRVRDVSGTFLELSYGWTPLLQDVFSAAKAFEAISNGPRGVTIKATKKFPIIIPPQNPQGLVEQRFEGIIRRTYTYEQSEELNALRSMGLLDPASILWERLPWSFVIDWFIPIGTYLDLIGVVPFLKGRFLRTTSGHNRFAEAVESHPGNPWPTVDYIPPFASDYFALQRVLLSTLTVPFPTVKVSGAIHGRRVGNAIALAHQMFDRALGFKSPTRLRHGSKFDKSDFSWPFAANFDR
jgi:hypothetical protein